MRTKFLFVFLLLGAFLCFTQSASAATVTFELDYEFSGATEPEGTAPWITATFTDTTEGVELTMSTSGLTDAEFVDEWLFNLDPSLEPAELTFEYVSGQQTDTVDNTVNIGDNAFKADGDGYFDIQFNFEPSNDPESDRFIIAETSVWLITSTEDIDANSFSFLSAPGGGNGAYLSAAHIQGIGMDDGDSGWIGAVPIPGSVLLLTPGLILLGALRRKFRF